MRCFLRAIGETFDVRRFLVDSTLRPDVHPKGFNQVFLDFGLRLRDVAAQTDVLPAELLWRAGALDIDITVTPYAIADEKH